jgi:glycosyltransferase involved in cell wall biosynthesis
MSLELLLGPQLTAVVEVGGEVLGISADGPFVEAVERRGVRHFALTDSTRGWNVRADLRAALQLWRILRRERPTVLHTHNPKPGLYGRVVGRLAGVPLVVNTVHGLYATTDDRWTRRAVVYALEAVASRFSDLELVQNAEDIETICRFRLASRRKVRHLGNGVDLTRFRPDRLTAERRRAVRSDWGAGDGDVVIGTVGRLVAEKGYPELFEAARGLGEQVRLVVVGGTDDDKADALDRTLVERAAADGVVFLGHRNDVADLLGAFDVFVLASHREGQPRAAMEAAATGLPIVATDIRGCRQVVEPEVTGLLVPPRNPTALAEAIRQFACSAAQRDAMGLAALSKAHHEFDERDAVARVMDSYRLAAVRRGFRLEGSTVCERVWDREPGTSPAERRTVRG